MTLLVRPTSGVLLTTGSESRMQININFSWWGLAMFLVATGILVFLLIK